MRATRWLAGLALIGMLAAPMRVEAQTYLTPDTWFTFSWADLGAIGTQFTASTSTLMVVDCCIVGDMFDVYAGGSYVGTTSSVSASDGTSTGAVTGDLAWADGRLSKGTFTVGTGDLIQLAVTQRADGYPSGDGFIMSATPEPGTIVLLLSGLAGIAFVGVRRKEDEIEG